MFWKFLVNCYNVFLMKMYASKKTPKSIQKLMLKLAYESKMGTATEVIPIVNAGSLKNRGVEAMCFRTAEHLSDRQRVAICMQITKHVGEDRENMCTTGKCVLTLTGEGCSPFETVHCETCGENICSLKVDYITEPFHKKYMER